MATAYDLELKSCKIDPFSGFGSFTVASGMQAEWCFIAPRAETITKGFVYVTGSVGSPSFKLSLQGRTAAGAADGVVKIGNGSANVEATVASPSSVGQWVTFGDTYTTTQGEVLTLVAALTAGTSVSFNTRIGSLITGNPYVQTFDGSTRTRQTNEPVWGVGTSSRVYGTPISGQGTQLYTSGSSPNEYGNLFTMPSYWSNATICGVKVIMRALASSTCTVNLYTGNNTSTAAASNSLVAEQLSTTSAYTTIFVPLTTTQTYNSGDTFRLTLKATHASNQTGIQYFDVLSIADSVALNQWNQGCYSCTRAGGAWTDSNTRIYAIWPIFSDATVVSSGSTTIIAPPVKRLVFPRSTRTVRNTIVAGSGSTTTVYVPLRNGATRTVVRSTPPVRIRSFLPSQSTTTTAFVPLWRRSGGLTSQRTVVMRRQYFIPGTSTTTYVPLPIRLPSRVAFARTHSVIRRSVVSVVNNVTTQFVLVQQPRKVR